MKKYLLALILILAIAIFVTPKAEALMILAPLSGGGITVATGTVFGGFIGGYTILLSPWIIEYIRYPACRGATTLDELGKCAQGIDIKKSEAKKKLVFGKEISE